jgi:hypothetical protein
MPDGRGAGREALEKYTARVLIIRSRPATRGGLLALAASCSMPSAGDLTKGTLTINAGAAASISKQIQPPVGSPVCDHSGSQSENMDRTILVMTLANT